MSSLTDMGLLLGGGSVLYSLKQYPLQLWNKVKDKLIYRVTIYDKDMLYYEIDNYVRINHTKKFKNLEAGFDLSRFEQTTKVKKLKFKNESSIFSIKYKGKRLYFDQAKNTIEHAESISSLFYHQYSIYGWKASEQIKDFLEEITDNYNKSMQDNKLCIFCKDGWDMCLLDKRFVKPLSETILNKDTKALILKDIHDFTNNKEWYYKNNVLYKRNILLYGPPGTGKTTLSMAIASELSKDIAIINLGSMSSDADFVSTIRAVSADKIILIEDADSAFEQRENKGNNKMSFSLFINWLDGAMSKEGSIVILTTNHIDKLDAALLRDGRMDIKLEIGNAGKEEVEEFLELFYELPERPNLLELEGIDLPMATVQEKCISNKGNYLGALKELTNLVPLKLQIA